MLEIRQNRVGTIKNYYHYSPSQAAAGVLCGLFAIGLALSIWQTIRHKAWIWIVMIVAILMEVIGFAARVVSAGDTSARTVYIIQFCLVILAPVLMAGVIYVVFGRLVFHVVPVEHRTIGLLWVPVRWLTPIFVGFDIFALFLQLVGAVIISATQPTDSDVVSKLQRGKDIALAGVTLQIAAFGLFSFVAARFHFTSKKFKEGLERRYQATPGDKFVRLEGSGRKFKPNWRALLYIINLSCLMILIRSIYREIDFAMGTTGYLTSNEWPIYVLDAAPMFIVVLCYTLLPPGAYVAMGWRQRSTDEMAYSAPVRDPEAYSMGPLQHR